MRGLVDDLKAVTSGAWLNAQSTHSSTIAAAEWIAGLLVYVSIIILGGADDAEKLVLVGAAFLSHVCLMYENTRRNTLLMHERHVGVSRAVGSAKKYARRLDMAKELIREIGRSDFAVRLGIINPDSAKEVGRTGPASKVQGLADEVVTM
jgi:hypothetical protein